MVGQRFVPGFIAPEDHDDACYVVFDEETRLLSTEVGWQPLQQSAWRFSGLIPEQQHFIGHYESRPCFAVQVRAPSDLLPGYRWSSVRSLIAAGAFGDAEFAMVGCGMQVFNWDRSHQYCGQCGSATVARHDERARRCLRCELDFYPKLSPCVIVLITRGDECLLARHARSRSNFYSPLAGFVEPGETAEGALHREVAEEVGLQVQHPRYFSSQSWPFPGQLMLGFHADYAGGDIVEDPVEIADARWWHYKDLPSIPSPSTLSGMLIRHFVNSRTAPSHR